MDQAVLVLYPSCVAALLSLGPLPHRPRATDVIVILAVLVALFAVASIMLLFSHPHGRWWGVVAYSDPDMRALASGRSAEQAAKFSFEALDGS